VQLLGADALPFVAPAEIAIESFGILPELAPPLSFRRLATAFSLFQNMASHICRLCGSDGPLCFSHVLPEFFYEGTYDEGHRFVSVTDHPRHRPRIMQKGLREHLLCAACEGRLSRYETYVAALLRAIDVDFAHGSRGMAIPGVDFAFLRLFALSLLWRCHVAGSHMFSAVDLGSHAETIRRILQSETLPEPYTHGFAIAKITGLETHGDLIISPVEASWKGQLAYLLSARGYEWVLFIGTLAHELRTEVPMVGANDLLIVQTVEYSKEELFASLRNAFPAALSSRG
jgi:hypothetical protein